MTDKKTLQKLEAAIIHCKLAERRDSEFTFTIGRAVKFFPASLVSEVEPRLPAVIDFLNTLSVWKTATLMRKTLKHWQLPGIPMESYPDVRLGFPRAIRPCDNPEKYLIKALRYQVFKLPDGLEVVVSANKKEEITVSKHWLDTNYHGLTIKLDLLYALSVDPLEASKAALEALPQACQDTDIDDVSFD